MGLQIRDIKIVICEIRRNVILPIRQYCALWIHVVIVYFFDFPRLRILKWILQNGFDEPVMFWRRTKIINKFIAHTKTESNSIFFSKKTWSIFILGCEYARVDVPETVKLPVLCGQRRSYDHVSKLTRTWRGKTNLLMSSSMTSIILNADWLRAVLI